MFKSKIRSTIISQYEHGRMAGTLASLWGNDNFDKTEIDFDAFIKCVTLHDWHFGQVDNIAIGNSSETEWLAVVQRGVEYRFEDPVTDIVVKKHILRLLGGHISPDVEKLKELTDKRILERLTETQYTLDTFDWADKITAFCDMVAFDFAFEKPLTRRMSVSAKRNAEQETTLEYEIKSNGKVTVSPWPFSMDSIKGVLISYQEAGYPSSLKPEIINFTIEIA